MIDVLQAQVSYLDNLKAPGPFFLLWRIFEPLFAACEDRFLRIFADTENEWKTKFVAIGPVQTAKSFGFLRSQPIDTRRTLIPQGFRTRQTFDRVGGNFAGTRCSVRRAQG